MRFVIFAVLVLIALLAAAVVVGPELINWNDYKPQIAKRIEQATGRAVSIDGDVSLKLLPTPAFSAEKVSVANFEGGTRPDMLTLDSLRVRVALLPLIQSKLQVRAVELRKPTIFLEVLPDGRRNWDIAGDAGPGGSDSPPDAAAGGDEDGAGMFSQVRLESFVVVDGTLVYRDSRSSFQERVEDIDARIAAESLEGPFALEGDAIVRGVATGFDVAVGRIATGGAAPVNLNFSLLETKASASVSGTVSIHEGETAFRGRLRAEATELSAAMARLAGVGESPMLSQPFSLDVTFQGSAKEERAELLAKEIRATIGDTSVSGEGRYATGTPAEASLDLQVARVNLDDWLAAARQETVKGAQGKTNGDGTSEVATAGEGDGTIVLPDDLSAEVSLDVQALVYRQQVVRQIGLRLKLDEGRLRVDRALALLPGGSDASLTGTLETANGEPAFSGRIEAASNNLRSLLSWLGVSVEGVRADRLRRMSLLSKVEVDARQITLRDIALDVDVSRISGGVAVALRERIGIGAGLTIDKVDLDAYLGGAGIGVNGASSGTDAGDGGQRSQTASHPPILGRFDANLDLRAGQVTWFGETARDLRMDGTLNHGELELRRLALGDLGGIGGEITGVLTDLDDKPGARLNLDFTVGDPARFAQMVGADVSLMRRLGGFGLSGALSGDVNFVELSALTLNGAGGQIVLDGQTIPLAAPPAFDLQLDVSHNSLPDLIARLLPETRLDPRYEKLELAGRLRGTIEAFTVEEIVGRLGSTRLSGNGAVELTRDRPAVNLTLETGELPLAVLGAPAVGAKSGNGGGSTAEEGRRWSRDPIDLTALEGFDAELALDSAALISDDHRLENAVLTATLIAGRLEVSELSGDFNQGRLTASGALDARGTPRIDLALDAQNVDVKGLAPELPLFGPVSGPVSLSARLNATGNSEAELVGGLNGRGTVDGDLSTPAGAEVGTGMEIISGGLQELLGGKVRIAGDVLNRAGGPVAALGGAAKLTGGFGIEQGVVRPRELRLIGKRKGFARIEGEVDLPAWRMDMSARVFDRQEDEEPALVIGAEGPLDAPSYRFSGAALSAPQRAPQPEPQPEEEQQGPAPSPLEQLLPLEPKGEDEPAPESGTESKPAQPDAEDLIRGILKGLQNQ